MLLQPSTKSFNLQSFNPPILQILRSSIIGPVLFVAVAIVLYATCVRAALDKTRSHLSKLVLVGGRATMTSFGLFLAALVAKMGGSPYSMAVAGFGCMIAAFYLPWIIADVIDGRTVKQGHGKPPEPKSQK